jgi:hypothetical protein
MTTQCGIPYSEPPREGDFFSPQSKERRGNAIYCTVCRFGENKIFLLYKEIPKGAVAKSYTYD